jgi:NDP-sugar pyrophosphorylase family protein
MTRVTSRPWFRERCNSIGKGTRIHPTAILEGCVVGADVEIGPFAYLRSAVIGNRAVIRERSTVTMSFVGAGTFLGGCDVLNTYIGCDTAIFGPKLYNAVFGERGLLGGASGFADFLVGSGPVVATIEGRKVPSNLRLLASAVGDDCFVGTNMVFAPGQTIPDGTRVFDHGLVKFAPTTSGRTYVVSGSDVIQVPDTFIESVR